MGALARCLRLRRHTTGARLRRKAAIKEVFISNLWSKTPRLTRRFRPWRATEIRCRLSTGWPSKSTPARTLFRPPILKPLPPGASGDYEKAVSLDPGFGAAWLSWVQARAAAAGDNPQAKQQASEIAARALGQPSLQSPVDRAQLEFLSATLRQDEPAQERALTALARLMPHDLTLLGQLATRETNARHFSEAARYYQAILQENPGRYRDLESAGVRPGFRGRSGVGANNRSSATGAIRPTRPTRWTPQGEASFLNGKFADAEKDFLDAHAKSSAMLGGGDLLKAAYSRWLAGDLPGADKLFLQYADFPHPAERPSGSVASGGLGVFHRSNRRRPSRVCRM